MILAAASVLSYIRDDPNAASASRAIYESVLEAVYDGIRTADLSGSATTTEFTDEVLRRTKSKLGAWDALGR